MLLATIIFFMSYDENHLVFDNEIAYCVAATEVFVLRFTTKLHRLRM